MIPTSIGSDFGLRFPDRSGVASEGDGVAVGGYLGVGGCEFLELEDIVAGKSESNTSGVRRRFV